MPSSLAATVVFLVIQAGSFLVLAASIAAYRRILLRHRLLMAAVDPGSGRLPGHTVGIMVWIYVVATVLVAVGTGVLFFLQPHIL